tara:strand:+ start:36210 stop:36659 length:450 start_codon:yes stop_codon:yes gene_type:complete
MKKRNVIISGILAASLLSMGVVGLAQACDGRDGPKRGHHGDKMMKVMEKLDLSAEQQGAIQKIRDEQGSKMKSTRAAMQGIRKALHEQTQTETFNADEVRKLADAKARIVADMTVQRIETMYRIHKELTPEQIAKMKKMKEHRHGPKGN